MKAAQVLEENSGMKTSTIHRAIGLFSSDEADEFSDGNNFSYHDFVVIDETSMCDVLLMSKLLKALKNPNVRLLIIGDDFQLSSVGAGNLLNNLSESNKFATTKLTQVFRQAEGGILDIATKVRKGEKWFNGDETLNEPLSSDNIRYGNDMIIHPLTSGVAMQKGLIYYFKQALEKYPLEEVKIILPMKKYELGVEVINKLIQELVNPASPDKSQVVFGKDQQSAVIFREGDMIINTKNNYKALNSVENEVTIYNGEMGVIRNIDIDAGRMVIEYPHDEVVIKTNQSDLSSISHSYALTIHKSQGSGFKCVIMATDKSHRGDPKNPMLNANLIYTGITRSREQMYWLCQPDIVNHAINIIAPQKRNCFLYDLITS